MTERREMPQLAIVVPCYNESEVVKQTGAQLIEILSKLSKEKRVRGDSLLCFVDDGSSDDTWKLIREACAGQSVCQGIRLTRNFGHQNAILAGLLSVPGDVLITMDADLQDNPIAIAAMLDEYGKGADVVFGVRSQRCVDRWWKRIPAEGYYRLLNLMGVELIANHADYRLMSRQVVESLRNFREVNLFLRGLIPLLGYQQAIVEYERGARIAGQSKYSLARMLALAINGVTSFTAFPLRVIAFLGVFVFLGSLIISAWALWIRLFTSEAVPGWASSVLPIYLLGGIQLLSIAVVGEYVSKVYLETKGRPRFLVKETFGVASSAVASSD